MSKIIVSKFLCCFIALFVLTGCHYHISSPQNTISTLVYIPTIENDDMGYVRSTLIHTLAEHHILTTQNKSAATHRLAVSLLSFDAENIGFRYATKNTSSSKKDSFIVSNEGRLSITAEIILDNFYNKPLLKTICHVNTSFDFEPDVSRESSHVFSLGQMEMYDEAKETAEIVLFEKLGATIGRLVSYEVY